MNSGPRGLVSTRFMPAVITVALAMLSGYLVPSFRNLVTADVVIYGSLFLVLTVFLLVTGRRWLAEGGALSVAVPVMIIGLWLVAQLWQAALPRTSPYAGIGLRWKNYLGLVVLVLWLWFSLQQPVALRAIPHQVCRPDATLISGLWFVIVAGLSMQIQQRPDFPLLVMYAGWIAYAYLVAPSLLQTRRDWLFAIKVLVIMLLLVVAWYIWSGISTGNLYWMKELAFVFTAVQIYGRALAVGLMGTVVLFFNSNSKWEKRWWLALTVVLFILLVLSISRSNLVFFIAFVLTIGMYARRHLFRMLVYTLFAIALVITIFAVLYLGWNQLDALSSGRLSIYSQIEQGYTIDNPVSDFLLGGPFELGERFGVGDESRVSTAQYPYPQAHNGFLLLFFAHGLLGLFFFLLPMLIIHSRLRRAIRIGQGINRTNAILAIGSLNGLALSSLTIPQVPSFGNPIAIFTPILWLPVLLHVSKQPEIEHSNT